MPKRKKHSGSVKFAAVGVGVLFLVAVLVMTGMIPGLPKYGLVVPGWEIYDQVAAIRHNDEVKSEESDFTSPKELMGVYWKVDVDDPHWGVATLMVQVGDIRHIDFTGTPTPNAQPAATMTVTRGNNTYYLDYHIYSYVVTIRTVADFHQYRTYADLPVWEHETSWPHEMWDWYTDHGLNTYVGTQFDGGVYTKFVISPWTGVSYRTGPNSSYQLSGCWAGVMNTYIMPGGKELGTIDNQWGRKPTADANAQPRVVGGLDGGNQVPMFEDDGTLGNPATPVPWDDNLNPESRIRSTVVQYLPVQMIPGAYIALDMLGGATQIDPLDVVCRYTLRIDVLQSHNFTLITAIKPPEPDWPSDYFGWAESFWTNLFAGLDPFKMFGMYEPLVWFLFTIGAILLIVFVLLAVFAPWVLPRIFKGVTSAGKAVREVTKKEKGG
ncbi:hypothetical protein MUP01_10735 [Candidatus Bathyarchaeota archaeon]|nr:hypothetical protein [Candidatus Bathyarchaeota archaeon]